MVRPRSYRILLAALFGAVVAIFVACASGEHMSTDNANPSRADSLHARAAVEQYLGALAARDYERAAFLFAGDWRGPAAHVLGDSTSTLSLAAFLRQTCTSGFYVCSLRMRRFVDLRFSPPDTFTVGVEYADSTGARFTWGPCCGESGAPDSVGGLRVIARDSGYAVLDLPLYIP